MKRFGHEPPYFESQNKDLKKVVGKRKEQATGVRAIIKGKHLLTVGEIYDKITGSKSATQQRREYRD